LAARDEVAMTSKLKKVARPTTRSQNEDPDPVGSEMSRISVVPQSERDGVVRYPSELGPRQYLTMWPYY
jgi:hypothetical protein